MKKEFVNPLISILRIQSSNIISTSNFGVLPEDEDPQIEYPFEN